MNEHTCHGAVFCGAPPQVARAECPACRACPQCGRPPVGRAFATTANYDRCNQGHVFPSEVTP